MMQAQILSSQRAMSELIPALADELVARSKERDALAARLAEAERLLDRAAHQFAQGHDIYRRTYIAEDILRAAGYSVTPASSGDATKAMLAVSAEAAPDLFKSMGLPTVEVPAWEKPLRQCHHGYFGDCPKCEADSASGVPE